MVCRAKRNLVLEGLLAEAAQKGLRVLDCKTDGLKWPFSRVTTVVFFAPERIFFFCGLLEKVLVSQTCCNLRLARWALVEGTSVSIR